MMNQLFRNFFYASLLFLAGCSAITELRLDLADRVFGREPVNAPVELKNIVNTQVAKLNWSNQLGKTDDYDLTPVLEAGFIFAASSKGEITKLNADSGKQEWRVNVEEAVSGGVGAGGGLVLVGTNRGNVLAYDMTGKQVWKSKLSSEVLSAPRYFDGKVIARSGDNRIYGLDAADGTRKWVYERQAPALSLRSSAGVVVDGGAVYAGFSGGKMAAIRADNGKLLWETTVAIPKGVTEIERIADITSLPVIAGPVVYAVAFQGRVAAVDRVNGKVLWNREISSYNGMTFNNEKLYLSHALGSIYSLDYTTGRTFWRQGDLLNRRLTAPIVINSTAVVGDLEGYLHFLDVEDGKFTSRMKVDSNAVMSIIQGNAASQVVVATRGGGLYAVSIESRQLESVQPANKPVINTDEQGSAEPSSKEVVPVAADDELDVEGAPYEPSSDTAGSEAVNDEEPRSILFEKNSILLPNDDVDNGPGIKLPQAK